jgi:Tfp pilus assembly protein PilN
MKRWKATRFLAVTLSCILSTLPASGQQSQPSDELKKDIEALKESVKAIQKDLQEIKTLLQARQQPAAPPQNVVLDLGKNPYKGERNAKLTLVEISDYQ